MTTLATLTADLHLAQIEYQRQVGEARFLIAQIRELRGEITASQERVENLTQIAAYLNRYADDRQAQVQNQIETIVSTGLQQIFAEDLTLRLVNKQVGQRSEIDFVLVSGTGDQALETSILDARGGGVAAVAGFLIQAVLVLLTPGMRPIMFLDESFAQVSVEYEEPLAEFIAELVSRTPLQVALVTHSSSYAGSADRHYRFSQTNGATAVEEVTP